MANFITVQELAEETSKNLKRTIYQASIRRFFEIFNIKWALHIIFDKKFEHWRSGLRLKNELYDVFKTNLQIFDEFDKDFYSFKSFKDIAQGFNIKENEVKLATQRLINDNRIIDQLNLLNKYSHNDGNLKYISSYQILIELNGELPKLNLGALKEKINKGIKDKFIDQVINKRPKVFADVFDLITEELDPIFDSESAIKLGVKKPQKPQGILLYGPPGCGKTHWAKEIARITEFKYEEIRLSSIGSTYYDGAMLNIKNRIEEVKKMSNVILFFDEFDSIAVDRSGKNASHSEDSKIVNTLLQEIPELIEKNIIIVAATNFIDKLDSAVIRSGRFKLKLPIFLPLPDERIELLVQFIFENTVENSTLDNLFKKHSFNKIAFWLQFKERLNLYSTSLVKELAEAIFSKGVRLAKDKGEEAKIDHTIILDSIQFTDSNLSSKEVEDYYHFYNEIGKNNYFPQRRLQLAEELIKYDSSNTNDEYRPKTFGFTLPDV